MTEQSVFPETQQLPGSSNIHIEQGKAMPSFDHGQLSGSDDIHHYFIKEVIEATNAAGNPRQWAFGWIASYYTEDGIRTQDQTFGDVVQGAAVVDDSSGGKLLIVGFGSGTPSAGQQGTWTKLLPSGAWTAHVGAGTTDATFWKIISVGPDAIAMTGGAAAGLDLGRTLLGEYHIAKCPAGSDPTLAASWGNIQPVGTPMWPILDIAPLFDSFCVAKGDGLWYWDARTHRFINALGRIQYSPHALNGKGMTAGENGVWYPMADGRLFFFDGTNVTEQSPRKGVLIPRDAYTSRATAIADRGDVVAVRMEPNYSSLVGPRASEALNMKVITHIGGVNTDITFLTTNGKLSDGGGMGTFGNDTNDRLFIKADTPFEAIIFRVTRLPNAAAIKFGTPLYGNGGATSAVPFTTQFTALNDIRDGTILGSAVVNSDSISLALTGYPPGASEAIVSWPDPNIYDLSQPTTLSFGGLIGDITGYWISIPPAAAGIGMTGTTEIDEVDIVPCRGGLPNVGLLVSDTNYTHRENSGSLGRVYIGRRGGGKITWENTYTIADGGGVWAMGFSSVRTGSMTNGGQPLILWGRYEQTIIAESITRDPSLTQYPKLVQGSTAEPMPRLAFRKLQLGDPLKTTALNRIIVWGEYITQADSLACYAWWDNADEAVLLDQSSGAPWVFTYPAMSPEGRELNFDILFYDGDQSDPTAPYISHVVVDYEDGRSVLPVDANIPVVELL